MENTKKSKLKIEILPSVEDQIYEQRESGLIHSPFQMEYNLYHAIKMGDVDIVKEVIEEYLSSGVIMGRLSENNPRQFKYWSVACISVAIHYAILGGLDETYAFNLSDEYIRHIDLLHTIEECIQYMREKAIELTRRVSESPYQRTQSVVVRNSLHYINVHLHERLTIEKIAEYVGVSRDYLSRLFKKEMAVCLHNYILQEKLEASKLLLKQGKSYDYISYNFSFCSETHYITCFKKEYGITPGEYKNKCLY